MNERKYESWFIPCGDALEKMDIFAEDVPEKEMNGENIQEVKLKASE